MPVVQDAVVRLVLVFPVPLTTETISWLYTYSVLDQHLSLCLAAQPTTNPIFELPQPMPQEKLEVCGSFWECTAHCARFSEVGSQPRASHLT